jgi:hypothetical protein
MIVFSITALLPNPKLDEAIKTNFPNSHLQVSPTVWLVAGSGTAQEVSNKIGLTEGGLGSAVIFSTSGYYGRAPSNIWEWIKAKMEAPVSG